MVVPRRQHSSCINRGPRIKAASCHIGRVGVRRGDHAGGITTTRLIYCHIFSELVTTLLNAMAQGAQTIFTLGILTAAVTNPLADHRQQSPYPQSLHIRARPPIRVRHCLIARGSSHPHLSMPKDKDELIYCLLCSTKAKHQGLQGTQNWGKHVGSQGHKAQFERWIQTHPQYHLAQTRDLSVPANGQVCGVASIVCLLQQRMDSQNALVCDLCTGSL